MVKRLPLMTSKSGKPLILQAFSVSHIKHKGKEESNLIIPAGKNTTYEVLFNYVFSYILARTPYHPMLLVAKTTLQNRPENLISGNQFGIRKITYRKTTKQGGTTL